MLHLKYKAEQYLQVCNRLPLEPEDAYRVLCIFPHGGRCEMQCFALLFGGTVLGLPWTTVSLKRSLMWQAPKAL